MNKPEFTEENLKKVLVEEYARAVASRPDCEESFRTLNQNDISIEYLDERLIVGFRCLQRESVAAKCAQQAMEETREHLFGDDMSSVKDWSHVVSGVPVPDFNFKTSPGRFEWRIKFKNGYNKTNGLS